MALHQGLQPPLLPFLKLLLPSLDSETLINQHSSVHTFWDTVHTFWDTFLRMALHQGFEKWPVHTFWDTVHTFWDTFLKRLLNQHSSVHTFWDTYLDKVSVIKVMNNIKLTSQDNIKQPYITKNK